MKNVKSLSERLKEIMESRAGGPVVFLIGAALGFFLVHGFLNFQQNYLWALLYR